ncbi:basic-leucine zipper transcription factor [Fusarium sporotrichioides]|uniref:Basic-leucine zipper transcription factor n=1 Tax=Fusarium sporotrichioides TaxID=5514 RepID=A0A395SBE6_FUSSP|nr:basic-leucine zipper transcription factor [Fusarium sporotrichioides]
MQSTESFRALSTRSDVSESIEDPNERRKIQNRIAQKKHRQKMKRRIEELETKVNNQCQTSNWTNGQLRTINHAPTDSCQEQQFLDNTDFGLMLEDDLLYRELSASLDSAGLTAVAQMHDSPRLNQQQRLSDMHSSPTSSSNIAQRGLAINGDQSSASNALSSLCLVPGSSEGSPPTRQHDSLGTSTMQPLRPSGMTLCSQDLRDMAPEDRMSRILKVIQDAGYKDMDSFMTEYYVGDFDASSHVSAVQRQSRSRRLRGFLEQLRVGAESWSDYEAHDYQDEISKSAEAIYAKELDVFSTTTVGENSSFEGLASLHRVLQNTVGSDIENHLRHEQSMMQRQLNTNEVDDTASSPLVSDI